MAVEKLSTEIIITPKPDKQAFSQMSSFVQAENKRLNSEFALKLSMDLSKLKVEQKQLRSQLKEAEKNGDLTAQVTITSNLERLREQITTAQAELKNFSKRGATDVSWLDLQFKKVTDAIEQSRQEIVKLWWDTTSLDKLKKQADTLQNSFKTGKIGAKEFADWLATLNQESAGATKWLGKLQGGLEKVTGVFGALWISVALRQLSQGILNVTDQAGKVNALRESFDNLQKTMGQDSVKTFKTLRDATRWAISDQNLLLSANKAMALWVASSSEEFTTLIEIARKKGQEFGLSTTQAFDDLVTWLGRWSVMILDNLGITTKASEAQEFYAQKLWKTVNQLTDAEKKQALINKVISDWQAQLELTGFATETYGEKIWKITARFDNFKVAIWEAFLPLLTSIVDKIVPVLNGMATWVEENQKLASFLILLWTGLTGFIGLLTALSLVLPWITTLTWLLGISIGSILGPIWLVVGAVALFAVAWSKDWGGIQAKTQAVITTIKNALWVLKMFFGQITANLRSIWNTFLVRFDKFTQTKVWKWVSNWLNGSNKIKKATKELWFDVTKQHALLWDNVANTTKKKWSILGSIINGIYKAIDNSTFNLVSRVRALLSNMIADAQNAYNAVQVMTGTATWIWTKIANSNIAVATAKNATAIALANRNRKSDDSGDGWWGGWWGGGKSEQVDENEAIIKSLEDLQEEYEKTKEVYKEAMDDSVERTKKLDDEIKKVQDSITDLQDKLDNLETTKVSDLASRYLQVRDAIQEQQDLLSSDDESKKIKAQQTLNDLLKEQALLTQNLTAEQIAEAERRDSLSATEKILEDYNAKKEQLENDKKIAEEKLLLLETQREKEAEIYKSLTDKQADLDRQYEQKKKEMEARITDNVYIESQKRIAYLKQVEAQAYRTASALASAWWWGGGSSSTTNNNNSSVVVNANVNNQADADYLAKRIVNFNKWIN